MLAFLYFFLVLFLASGYHEADFRKGNEEPRHIANSSLHLFQSEISRYVGWVHDAQIDRDWGERTGTEVAAVNQLAGIPHYGAA